MYYTQQQSFRYSENKDLFITNDPYFYIDSPSPRYFPIMRFEGGIVLNDLASFYQTLSHALIDYNRVFAFRVDLYFPEEWPLSFIPGNEVMHRFFKSFNKRIKSNRAKARARGVFHDTKVRYAWSYEEGGVKGRPHYHLFIFLNGNAYNSLGDVNKIGDSIWGRVVKSWAAALKLSEPEYVHSMVNLPENATYMVERNELFGRKGRGLQETIEYNPYGYLGREPSYHNTSLDELFYRASYLFKVSTKVIGERRHRVGFSRE